MDVLADLLTVTRLAGDVFTHTLAEPPWGLRYTAAKHVWFHIVANGSLRLVADGEEPRLLGERDLILLPHGGGHLLCDHPDSAFYTVDPAWLLAQPQPMRLKTQRKSNVRDRDPLGPVEFMCGRYIVASPHPVLRLLPKVIHVPAAQLPPALDATLSQLCTEIASGGVGSRPVVTRLLEVLLVQVLRDWLATQPAEALGWVGALRDDAIGNAIGLLHASYAKDWTVQSLAREVGLSRPVFARRFQEQVGETPMNYLRGIRIEVASRLLGDTSDSLAAIANAVGYESEYAFSRAFQRDRGIAPGRFRKRSLAAVRR